MWRVYGCKEDAENVQREAKDREWHGDVEFFHDLWDGDGV
jgi:hypothetical protein